MWHKLIPHRDITGEARIPGFDYRDILLNLKQKNRRGLCMVVENYGVCLETFAIDPDAFVCFRFSSIDQWNVPGENYTQSPVVAAQQHFTRIKSALPTEWNPNTYLVIWNEVDKNRLEYVAETSLHLMRLLKTVGIKALFWGLNSGEPEPEAWEGPKMLTFLNELSQQEGNYGIAFHEYWPKEIAEKDAIPWRIGRWKKLEEVCVKHKIDFNFPIAITEFGFGYNGNSFPEHARGLEMIERAIKEYDHPNIHMLAFWVISSNATWGGNISQKVMTYFKDISPRVTQAPVQPPPLPIPPSSTFLGLLYRRNPSAGEWQFISNISTEGIPDSEISRPGTGRSFVGTFGWAHTDLLEFLRLAVNSGASGSRLIVLNGHLIGTGLDSTWITKNYPDLLAYIVFKNTGDKPVPPPPPPTPIGDFFASPVGPRDQKDYPPKPWIDANPYGNLYNDSAGNQAYHTGSDLNLNVPNWDDDKGKPVYSIGPGTITFVGTRAVWGHIIIIEHSVGGVGYWSRYSSILPHQDVWVGKQVTKETQIGVVDRHEGKGAFHLHFDIMKRRVDAGDWPRLDTNRLTRDYMNPINFFELVWAKDLPGGDPITFPPPSTGFIFNGLHLAATGGVISDAEIAMVRSLPMNSFKALSSTSNHSLSALRSEADFWVIRAFLDFGGRNISPAQFVNDTVNDVRRSIDALAGKEVVIELHNEPNLQQEGFIGSWANAQSFDNWLVEVIRQYRIAFPGKKLVFPGLSPGASIGSIRLDDRVFYAGVRQSLSMCDYIGIHTYWSNPDYPLNNTNYNLRSGKTHVDWCITNLARPYGKKLLITEYSNNGVRAQSQNSDQVKGKEYKEFVQYCKGRSEVAGLYSYVASAHPGTFVNETWLGSGIPVEFSK